jgi:hypothetical protein
MVEEAAVFVVADDHRGLFPHLRVRGENAQQVHDADGADRGRQCGMLALDDRRDHPRDLGQIVGRHIGGEH